MSLLILRLFSQGCVWGFFIFVSVVLVFIFCFNSSCLGLRCTPPSLPRPPSVDNVAVLLCPYFFISLLMIASFPSSSSPSSSSLLLCSSSLHFHHHHLPIHVLPLLIPRPPFPSTYPHPHSSHHLLSFPSSPSYSLSSYDLTLHSITSPITLCLNSPYVTICLEFILDSVGLFWNSNYFLFHFCSHYQLTVRIISQLRFRRPSIGKNKATA